MSKIVANVKAVFKGGAGSGHHGHAGRPGKVGGSASSGGGKGKGGGGKTVDITGTLDEYGVQWDAPFGTEGKVVTLDFYSPRTGSKYQTQYTPSDPKDMLEAFEGVRSTLGAEGFDISLIPKGFHAEGTKVGKFTFESPYTRGSISGDITRQFGTFADKSGVKFAAGITLYHGGDYKGKIRVEFPNTSAVAPTLHPKEKWFDTVGEAWGFIEDIG